MEKNKFIKHMEDNLNINLNLIFDLQSYLVMDFNYPENFCIITVNYNNNFFKWANKLGLILDDYVIIDKNDLHLLLITLEEIVKDYKTYLFILHDTLQKQLKVNKETTATKRKVQKI